MVMNVVSHWIHCLSCVLSVWENIYMVSESYVNMHVSIVLCCGTTSALFTNSLIEWCFVCLDILLPYQVVSVWVFPLVSYISMHPPIFCCGILFTNKLLYSCYEVFDIPLLYQVLWASVSLQMLLQKNLVMCTCEYVYNGDNSSCLVGSVGRRLHKHIHV